MKHKHKHQESIKKACYYVAGVSRESRADFPYWSENGLREWRGLTSLERVKLWLWLRSGVGWGWSEGSHAWAGACPSAPKENPSPFLTSCPDARCKGWARGRLKSLSTAKSMESDYLFITIFQLSESRWYLKGYNPVIDLMLTFVAMGPKC